MFSLCRLSIIITFFIYGTTVVGSSHVRVLLDEGDVDQRLSEWQFITGKKTFLCSICPSGHLICNGKKIDKNGLLIMPEDNRCSYKDGVYAGAIALIVQDKKWYVINNISLDDYVYSVLRSESWPGWPLEVNKVFAIMVRTYVLHKMMMTKNMKKPQLFDIRSTNIHQTYKGVHDFEHLHQAVNETHNIILTYNKQPIVAMYDSCCGGVVPASITGFDFKTNPYLARSYRCTYCVDCKLYDWEIIYHHDQLLQLLQKDFPELQALKEIRLSRVDAAGKVIEVSVKSGRMIKKISGTALYKLCKDIRSFCYDIKKSGKNFIFSGKGFGHHMGLCQWGARAMQKKGFAYKEILDFYYPGTTLMKLVTESSHAAT